ncbi:efflux RND transporter periplasmic adaptor subunit [Pseudomonas sp. NPDC088429]|uniref:efflux RND transporter periplasmic adaptor subunit n=1 Tax=Pseudomonas sp. NPDC088429 TaxID=3364455 RepID=UPI0038150CF3
MNDSRRSPIHTVCSAALVAALLISGSSTWGNTASSTENAARGVLRAEREVVLSSSVSERIQQMAFREGDHFTEGQILVAFDCGRLNAELRAARADAAMEARNAQVQSELLTMDATGRADADVARLKHQERQAQADVIRERMTGCKVLAPFSGSVVETMVRVDETPPPNEKLLKIVKDGPLELHMVVPSKWLPWLKRGSAIHFVVDETGDTLQATVTRISGAVDAVSQTIKIIADVVTFPDGVLPGMSGSALLNDKKQNDPADSGKTADPTLRNQSAHEALKGNASECNISVGCMPSAALEIGHGTVDAGFTKN